MRIFYFGEMLNINSLLLHNGDRKIVPVLFREHTKILAAGIAIAMIFGSQVVAYASNYETYQGVLPNGVNVAGVRGQVTTDTPYIGSNHGDYLVYVNIFATTSSMGAGWFASEDQNGNVVIMDEVYYSSPSTNTVHYAYTTMSSGVTFTAVVWQSSSSSSDCWTGITYSNSLTRCFATGSRPAGMAGNIGRANEAYSS